MLNKIDLENEYASGKSMLEISQLKKCSVHKVQYWMKKYSIKRRSINDAIYIKHNPEGNPFKIKPNLSPTDKILYGLGVGIYWGEGTKVGAYSLRVANTDPGVIKTFRKFLFRICQVKPEKISYSLICFNDTNLETAKKFWSSKLEISPLKFGKITVIPKQGKGTYKKKSIHGVCTINFSNTKLKKWMLDQIDLVKYSN